MFFKKLNFKREIQMTDQEKDLDNFLIVIFKRLAKALKNLYDGISLPNFSPMGIIGSGFWTHSLY